MSARRRCAVSDCRHAPNAHDDRGCRLCYCEGWLESKQHRWRYDVTEAWFFATHAWLLAAEAATNGWTTELADFEANHPRPRLGDFMEALSLGNPPELLDRLITPHVCDACNGTGRAA
jgi:hypothetical protein